VDTKLLDLGAGKPHSILTPGQARRRQLLQAALVGSGLLAAGVARSEGKVLVPGPSYMGAPIVQRVNEAGFPEIGQGGFGPMTQFVAPVAVAVSPMQDIYVADAGLAVLFRFDPSLNVLSIVRGIRVTQQTRIAAMSDGSVVVANGGTVPAVRITRSGRPLQGIDGRLGSAFYDEVAIDSTSGKYYGLDRVQGRLEEIMPHGGGATLLPAGVLPQVPLSMAMDGKTLYVAGRTCQCVVAIDMFASRDVTVIAEDAGEISAMAAGAGWLALADRRDKMIRLYRAGAELAEIDFQTLRLVDPRGMAIANQTLYVVDTVSRRLLTFRIRA